MRQFNESIILLAAAVTFLDFWFISRETSNGPLSPLILPVAFLILLTVAFLSSKKDLRFAFYKILLSYCIYACGFVGVLAPVFELIIWLFSGSINLSSGYTLLTDSVLYQLGAGVVFAFLGYFAFKRLELLHART